ncbi:hypothetical protein ACWGDE_12160 [Streptomyces sp. NPDC054956]
MVALAELVFSAGDLARVRFAVSPMWEVAPTFRLLGSAAAHPVHQRRADQVRPRMVAAGLDRGRLRELIPPTGYVPDFLNPAPAGPAPTPAEERDAILSSPADRVRQDLASGPSWTRTSSAGPGWPPSTAPAISSTPCTRR